MKNTLNSPSFAYVVNNQEEAQTFLDEHWLGVGEVTAESGVGIANYEYTVTPLGETEEVTVSLSDMKTYLFELEEEMEKAADCAEETAKAEAEGRAENAWLGIAEMEDDPTPWL